MTTSGPVRLTAFSPGGGCASKLPLGALDGLMGTLGATFRSAGGDLLVGAAEGDDAAVLRLDDDRALVLTTDFFTPVVDDARDWGRIAAANALSDVYATGGRPLAALNLVAWPADRLPMELLAEVLRGGAEVAARTGCPVVGGHTVDDPVPKYGLAVVGIAHPDRLLTIDRARAGDLLVLTKPIGTGVVTTALKRGAADPDVVAAAVASMTALNADAAAAGLAAGVRAATDVTGFGLLGHLHRMLRASGLRADVHAARVPLLPGVTALVEDGHVPGGTKANVAYLADRVTVPAGVPRALSVLLHDAQTSGGLLFSASRDAVAALTAALADRGVQPAVIGEVHVADDGSAGTITVH